MKSYLPLWQQSGRTIVRWKFMLFLSEQDRQEIQRLLGALSDSKSEPAPLARRMIELDPYFAPGYGLLAVQAAQAGDLDGAEDLLWKALESWPITRDMYSAFSTMRQQRDPEDALAEHAKSIGLWKIALGEDIPEGVPAEVREVVASLGDPEDPATYETLADAMEKRVKDTPLPP